MIFIDLKNHFYVTLAFDIKKKIMKGGKIFELLKTFSKKEFKDLKNAVNSPLFTSNERVYQLYEVLKSQHPHFDLTEKNLQKIFKSLFPNEPYNYFKLHRLFGELRQLTEDYLIYKEQQRNALDRQKKLLLIYHNRNLPNFFEATAKQLDKSLNSTPFRDLEHYANQIFLHQTRYFNPLNDKYDLKDESLDRLVDALDSYFLLAKMRFGISVKNRERILAKPGIWRFEEALIQETKKGFMTNSVVAQLYRAAFLMFETSEAFSFEDYEAILFKHIDELRYDAKVLFLSGLNYVIQQLNRGNAPFNTKAFNWYRLGIEKKLLFENGKLDEVAFGNIVISACKEKEFGWAKSFIENQAKYLRLNNIEEVRAYHIGLLHFYQKEYDAVLSVFFNYQFSKAYIPKTRYITINALFELFLKDRDYFDVLNANIKAYESFITRNKKYTSSKLLPHLNSIVLIRKMAKMIWDNKESQKIYDLILKEISSSKNMIGKKWFSEKAAGFNNK